MSSAIDVDGNSTLDAEQFDVLIIGAGFAGLYQLDSLRRRGFKVQLIEAGADVGGVWYWNSYPGARLDSEGAVYQFSREDLWKDWDFGERFPGRDEVYAYFKYVDKKLDLSRDIRFNTRVTKCAFDSVTNTWGVETDTGFSLRANFMVMCTGFASKPYIPELQGLESFAGECHHTGLWPKDGIDFEGKSVAVIGTGASGVQVIQEISPIVKDLTVFQRTPNTAFPMGQQRFDGAAKLDVKKQQAAGRFQAVADSHGGVDVVPLGDSALAVSESERNSVFEQRWNEGGFGFWLGTFADVMQNADANAMAYAFWRDKVRARVKDPAMQDKLAPMKSIHPIGTKRPSLEQRYYEVYNQPNVRLVDVRADPIVEITPTGLRTTEAAYEFDILVLATGYDGVTGGLTSIDIRGTDDQLLRDKWKSGAKAYLGFGIHGFPNMFVIYGPQSPSSFCNGPTCAEIQGAWVVDCLEDMRARGYERIEATEEAQDSWAQHATDVAMETLFVNADSWWMGANIPGKARQLLSYAGGQPAYFEKCREVAANGYEGFTLS
ncbi:cyclohexanone monooxygenase [Sphingopyxis panaciterrae]|uniref:flavin-containing monooxygenase n=1 Tax=Sphingopyxis panaciterrae TaxID=363841 RepID=UPI0014247EE6|nr:NAD(P)/FAD-dependent oxidoreductase [Sphingopyxis panaciterrae]NIJ36335.1 cyclohexanone monooxygenase [Sphingopyxis panaciterrae]